MNLTLVIDDGRLAELLRAAHTDTARWCSTLAVSPGENAALYRDVDPADFGFYYPLREGKWDVRVHGSDELLTLDRAALERGIQHIADHLPHYFYSLLTEDLDALGDDCRDADLGDLLVQYSLFGEERFPHSESP